jgi:hypothetical protein
MTTHRKPLDATTRSTLADGLQQLERLTEARDLDAAQALADNLITAVRRAGINSACLAWLRAIVTDLRGDPLQALHLIEEALAVDPIAPPFLNSRAVIVRRLREALCRPDREAADPETLTLWNTLAHAGAADDSCHLALVRHHVAKGNDLEALRLLDAVTTLSPASVEAWAMKAQVATRLGDIPLASEASAEAAALGEPATSFGAAPMAEG